MAMLSQGIVGGNMAWPLVIVGILMGITMIMIEVKSPMLFSVGMYLPIEKAEMILRLLLEGNSVSSVSRFLDVHIATILKLLVIAGEKCNRIMADKNPQHSSA